MTIACCTDCNTVAYSPPRTPNNITYYVHVYLALPVLPVPVYHRPPTSTGTVPVPVPVPPVPGPGPVPVRFSGTTGTGAGTGTGTRAGRRRTGGSASTPAKNTGAGRRHGHSWCPKLHHEMWMPKTPSLFTLVCPSILAVASVCVREKMDGKSNKRKMDGKSRRIT